MNFFMIVTSGSLQGNQDKDLSLPAFFKPLHGLAQDSTMGSGVIADLWRAQLSETW